MPETPTQEMTMQELLDQEQRVSTGKVVTGQVVKIGADEIVVDVGYKTEGVIPRTEFQDITGELTVKLGDQVEVSVERMADSNGRLRLSKRNVDKSRVWQSLEEVFNVGGFIKGRVLRKVNGGFRVDLGNVEAFLPASQVSLQRNSIDEPIDQIFEFKIIKLDRARYNIVVSRRPVLELQKDADRQKRIASLNPGDILEGKVKSLVTYGAFVDLDGVDGLLHIADMDWGRVNRVEDFTKVGDILKVMVLNVDKEKGKVSLGIKQMTTDPWTLAGSRYHVGQAVEVEVGNLLDYGVFMKTQDHLEGFCHISELSWSKKIKKPSDLLKSGEKRQAQIIDLDLEKRKIGFSLKKMERSPWEGVSQRYSIGSVLQGTVSSVAEFGVFVEIEPGLEGLLHQSDITWDKRAKAPQKAYKSGQVVHVKILGIDTEKKRISLGVKQVEGDPWDKIEEKYQPGRVLTAKVSRLAEFGAFLELEKNVDGLVHKTELAASVPKKVEDVVKPGDELTVKVLSVDTAKRRIALSVKALTIKVPTPEEKAAEEEGLINRRTSTFQKMLKKFLKKAKTEDEEFEDEF